MEAIYSRKISVNTINLSLKPYRPSLATKFAKPRFHLSYIETDVCLGANLNFIYFGLSKPWLE